MGQSRAATWLLFAELAMVRIMGDSLSLSMVGLDFFCDECWILYLLFIGLY